MGEYLYDDLTYVLIKLGYSVFNRLNFGYQEKYYQRAYAEELIQNKLIYQKEQRIIITYNGKMIGRYFIDFLVENKVVIELKVGKDFQPKHIGQVLGYLKAKELRVGLILLFTKDGLKIKRLIL
ncbi:MAG: GxxExxY protein [Candidatus Magasanikbacteria bacterium]|nr:GxxExxY protein [Candidatus Magasanikbacteria bacterium]